MKVSSFGVRKVGRGEEMDIPREGVRLPHTKKNKQQQLRPNGKIAPRQGYNKVDPSNPTEGMPGEQVWVDLVEALARAKTLRGRKLLLWRNAYAETKNER